MYGALSTCLLMTLFALVALRPPMPGHSSPFNLQFGVSWIINEQPILGFWWLLSGILATLTRPQLASPLWWAIAGITLVGTLVLTGLGVRTRSARPALAAALTETFGALPRRDRHQSCDSAFSRTTRHGSPRRTPGRWSPARP